MAVNKRHPIWGGLGYMWPGIPKPKKAPARVPHVGNIATKIAVPFGFVRFWPPGHPEHAVMVPMGNHGWVVARTSGWDAKQRPFGLAVATWNGMPAVEATVDVVLERWEEQESVQPAYDLLLGLMNHGAKPVTSLRQPPPPLMVTRGAQNAKVTGPKDDATRWVITAIDPDEDQIVRDHNNNLLRFEGTVSLMQYVAPTTLRDSAATIRRATPKKRRKPYKTKKGDTFLSIAVHELHDRSKAPDIRDLNPKAKDRSGRITRDLRRPLKPDQSIQLPT